MHFLVASALKLSAYGKVGILFAGFHIQFSITVELLYNSFAEVVYFSIIALAVVAQLEGYKPDLVIVFALYS